jgi:glucokinase
MQMMGLELRDRAVVAVALDDDGRVLSRAEEPVVDDWSVATLNALGHVADAGDLPVVGVASATPESESGRRVLESLQDRFAGALTRNRIVESGTASAVAEAWIGAARGASHVVYLAVGDHTSAGVIGSGLPLIGAHGRAASAAWLALNPVQREDYRNAGCFEAEVAAAGIVRRLVWRIKAGDPSKVQAMADNFGAITVDHILQAARAGDNVAISVMRDTAKYVGMAAANLVVIADPEVLVLGGIIALAEELLFDLVKTEIARRVPESMMRTLTIVPAQLGDDAAAIGAARLAARQP